MFDVVEQIVAKLHLLPDLRFVPRVRVFVRDFDYFDLVDQQANDIGVQRTQEGEGRHVRSRGPAATEAAPASLDKGC